MGFLQDVKSKLTKAVDSQGDKIGQGLEKAGDMVDKKTGGKYAEKIESGVDKAKDALDDLDGKNDDIS
ncbi:MAG TPA: antitoxin [Marmoricola sp.]